MKSYPAREKKFNEVWYQRKGLTANNPIYSESCNTPAALAMALDMSRLEVQQYKVELEKLQNKLNGVLAGNGKGL